MPQHNSKARSMSDVVRTLLNPAMTSHYECVIIPKPPTTEWIKKYRSLEYDENLITLSCSSATLPGSTFMTHDVSNDYTGITEKIPYRRSYDDRTDFTFYVDSEYKIIKFFEYWMQYIANEQKNNIEKSNYSYKVNYPDVYRGTVIIDKFDRDYNKGIRYTFVDAYPSNLASMPISYDRSSVLTATVSFSYSRYYVGEPVIEPKEVNNYQNVTLPGLTQFNKSVFEGIPTGELNENNFISQSQQSNYQPPSFNLP